MDWCELCLPSMLGFFFTVYLSLGICQDNGILLLPFLTIVFELHILKLTYRVLSLIQL